MADVGSLDELVRGLVGAVCFAGLFAAARYRFADREQPHGPADVGLD